MNKEDFINCHFPKSVVKQLNKMGMFKKPNPTHEEIEKRICQFFGLESIFDYAKIGENSGVHLTLTKRGSNTNN